MTKMPAVQKVRALKPSQAESGSLVRFAIFAEW